MDLNLSKKQAKDVNDEDLGEVQEVDQNYVLIQKGTPIYPNVFSRKK